MTRGRFHDLVCILIAQSPGRLPGRGRKCEETMRRHRPRLGALISLIAAVPTLLASLPPNAALAEGLLLPPRSSGTPLPAAGMDNAWTIVRAALPANQPVYRPTWLPARFQSAPLGPTPGPSF